MNDSSVSAPARVQSTDSPVMGGLLLRSLGSLYFAAVLLMLWLVGMACATVYESTHSASRALAEFYTTPWFKGLLVLLAMNVAASMVARYPFSKRQLGFVITHGGILVTLGGALITDRLAVNGNVQFFERDMVDEFSTPGDVLTLSPAGEPARFATVDLDARGFGGFAEFDEPAAPPLELDDLRAEIVRYLPDSRRVRRVQDDGHQPQTAVEISLSAADGQGAAWLFADQPRKVGGVNAVLRTAADPQKLDALLSPQTTDPEAEPGSVRIELEGHPYEIPLPECLDHPVPLGDTQTSV
ncbi:MAG: hypothetical protein GY842_17165, partial [bacterium]|nr:hypothetical protein [bacterium]